MEFQNLADIGYLFSYCAIWFKENILELGIRFYGREVSLGSLLFWVLFGSAFLRYVKLWME